MVQILLAVQSMQDRHGRARREQGIEGFSTFHSSYDQAPLGSLGDDRISLTEMGMQRFFPRLSQTLLGFLLSMPLV